ncbi:MAG: hypothetical protein ACYC6Z_09505 [Thermoleophilia bacterium]
MRFKGGLANGALASIYGAASYICLFMAMNQHDTMKTICYVLGAAGIILAIYWFVTSEVMGIPILLTGICHIGLGARADHVGMQIGCTGLAVVAFAIGVIMLTMVKSGELGSRS